jgi:hypothetical protein
MKEKQLNTTCDITTFVLIPLNSVLERMADSSSLYSVRNEATHFSPGEGWWGYHFADQVL